MSKGFIGRSKISSLTNKPNLRDVAEIVLKVALETISLSLALIQHTK